MSTNPGATAPQFPTDIAAFFDDSTVSQEAVVNPTIELPVAYIHNPEAAQLPGGLFVKKELVPEDTKIAKDVELVTVQYTDEGSTQGYRNQEGYLLKNYHIALIAFDHDSKGVPRSRRIPKSETSRPGQRAKDEKDKYAFYVTGYIRQLYHPDLILSIKFGGPTHAFAAEVHLKNFMKYIVGETTRLKNEIQREKGQAPTPCSWNQFFVPFRHENAYIGLEKKSWVAQIQEYEKSGLQVAGLKRNGVSTLKKFAEKTPTLSPLQNLLQLYIPAKDPELAKRIKELMPIYADTVKTLEPFQGKGNNVSEHFTDDPENGASDTQVAEITELASQLGVDPDTEVKYLREKGTLKGGDESANRFSLSTTGAKILIAYLKDRIKEEGPPSRSQQVELVNPQTVPQPGPVQRHQPSQIPAKDFDEDDIPFSWIVGALLVGSSALAYCFPFLNYVS